MKKQKVLGWICVVWGGLVVLNGLPMLFRTPGSAYGLGQLSGFLFGLFMLYAGIRELRKQATAQDAGVAVQHLNADPGAKCATHPDRVAGVICARCGSYACAECTTPQGELTLCPPCVLRERTGGLMCPHCTQQFSIRWWGYFSSVIECPGCSGKSRIRLPDWLKRRQNVQLTVAGIAYAILASIGASATGLPWWLVFAATVVLGTLALAPFQARADSRHGRLFRI